MYNIKPLISEKSVSMIASSEYTLLVPKEFTKKKIEAVIKEVYKITPLDVRTSIKKSLKKKKAKAIVKDRGFKKVILKLKTGDSIPGFESFLEDKSKSNDVKTEVRKAEPKTKQKKTEDKS